MHTLADAQALAVLAGTAQHSLAAVARALAQVRPVGGGRDGAFGPLGWCVRGFPAFGEVFGAVADVLGAVSGVARRLGFLFQRLEPRSVV